MRKMILAFGFLFLLSGVSWAQTIIDQRRAFMDNLIRERPTGYVPTDVQVALFWVSLRYIHPDSSFTWNGVPANTTEQLRRFLFIAGRFYVPVVHREYNLAVRQGRDRLPMMSTFDAYDGFLRLSHIALNWMQRQDLSQEDQQTALRLQMAYRQLVQHEPQKR